jgi:putative spermidine/putrescine transport system ATP-binding protein
VAQFVGTLNTVSATVVDPKEGILRLEGQQIQTLESLDGVKANDQVLTAIRPERISFLSDGEKANRMEGVVQSITFLGAIVRIQLQVGTAEFHMDTFNNPQLDLPKTGETVQVTFSRRAVLVLTSGGTA